MLRPLLGRPVVAVIMATIGLAAILRGLPPITIGAQTKALPLPIGDEPISLWTAVIPPVQLVGVLVSLGFLAVFTWFFLKSRMGVAMRAVADNQQVAMAMGINVERYFAIAWAMAGVVSALGGIIWGSMLGVDTQLALIGLKVFPVVILGGLDSIVGAVVGGLIVGVVESLAAGYLDPYVGGGTKDFAPYVLMIIMLMFKPYGIFGHAQDRAGVTGRYACSIAKQAVFKTTYAADMALFPLPIARWTIAAILVLFAVVLPLDARRLLSLDHQPLPDRHRRRARPQHPRRLHRPDLGRPCRLHVGRRLHGRQSGGEARPAVLGDAACGRADGGFHRRAGRHP